MPVMDGHDSTKQLRARGHTTPIVALTGSVTQEDRRQCDAEGMNGFL